MQSWHQTHKQTISNRKKRPTLPAEMHAMRINHMLNCLPAEEGTVKQSANAAHEQLVLHRHSRKVDSLVSRPDGNLSCHGRQKVLLKLVADVLCTMYSLILDTGLCFLQCTDVNSVSTHRPTAPLHNCDPGKEESNIEGCVDEGVCGHLRHTEYYNHSWHL